MVVHDGSSHAYPFLVAVQLCWDSLFSGPHTCGLPKLTFGLLARFRKAGSVPCTQGASGYMPGSLDAQSGSVRFVALCCRCKLRTCSLPQRVNTKLGIFLFCSSAGTATDRTSERGALPTLWQVRQARPVCHVCLSGTKRNFFGHAQWSSQG